MASLLSFLLILTGLTGILSITTISEVSVKTGGSVSIPCLYDSKYINHVKYLCKGYYYYICSYVVKTNQPSSSGKFSLSDDKSRRIFTVTINDVTDTDTDYWCIVEINGDTDYGRYFRLSVNNDTPRLYVDHQEVTGTKGGNISISCHYSNPGVMQWCKLGGFCVTWPSGIIDGTTVIINASIPNVFTATMHGLMSSGWYYCVKGDFQMPVHVTLNEQPISTTSSFSPTAEPLKSATGSSVAPKIFTSEAPPTPAGQLSAFDHLKIFSIRLSTLILVVMAGLFVWFIVKRYKEAKVESSASQTAEGEVRYMRKTSDEKSHAASGDVKESCGSSN